MELHLTTVPVELFPYLLESNSINCDASDWICSNTLVIGEQCISSISPGTISYRDVKFTFNMGVNDATTLSRRMQVVSLPGLISQVVVDENDVFNLLKSVVPASEVAYKNINFNFSFGEDCPKPLNASEVKICLVKSFLSFALDVIDAALLNYFKRQRFLYKNDIFSVDLSKHLPELKYTKGLGNMSVIYFKVCDINGGHSDSMDGSICGYLVDNTVSLYQVSTQNEFIPSVTHSVDRFNKILVDKQWIIADLLKPLLPPYLHLYADKLKKCFRPFMIYKSQDLQLKPLFLVNGPVGCGKTLLVSNVAKLLGLQYWRVECSGLISGPSGFNEAKLKSIFTKAKKHLPCLLQLNNLEALSEDREGNEDIRVIGCFNRLMTELDCDLPLLIVGTVSSVENLSSELLQNILQVIDIENPSLNERADTMTWLCRLPQPDSLKVAARTSGFALSDLTFLVNQTYREKYKLTCEFDENELQFEDFIGVIDKMNAQTAGAIGAPQVPTVAWSDVGGHNEIKKEIVRSLNTASFGSGLQRSGILLWGPPGTGKTLLAKAVATECRSTFLSVKGPELLNMYVGQSEQNVRQVFQRAREAAPCIIFFDELDSLAPNRGKSDSAGVMDRVVSQLLSEMDGLQRNEGVFVLGATNRPDLIDPALLRPGRLDKMIYVGPCEGTEAKLSVLKALTRKFKMKDSVDLKQIAESLPLCLTGADLYSICYNAWQNAARSVIRQMQSCNPESVETVIVSDDDFIAAVNNLTLAS